jgi:hypothetical protein
MPSRLAEPGQRSSPMPLPDRTQPRSAALAHPLTQVALAAVAGGLFAFYGAVFRIAIDQHGNDFGKFYYATRGWLEGASFYTPNLATNMRVGDRWIQLLDLNPPHFHALVLPFVRLPLAPAFVLWSIANAAAATAAIAIAVAVLGVRPRASHVLPAICVTLLLAPTTAVAVTGQFTGLLMLLTALAWREGRRTNWVACGIWLGLAVGVKPFLALFGPILFITGRWRAAFTVVLTAAASLAIGVLAFGWTAHIEWMRTLGRVEWTWSVMNGSVMALVDRALAPSPLHTPVVSAAGWTQVVWLGCVLPVLVISFLAARRSIDHMFAVTVLASLLVSPLGWIYYLWLGLPAFAALWHQRVPRVAMLGIVALCMPLFNPPWRTYWMSTLTLGSAYTWGTLALWLGVVLTQRDSDVHPPTVTGG